MTRTNVSLLCFLICVGFNGPSFGDLVTVDFQGSGSGSSLQSPSTFQSDDVSIGGVNTGCVLQLQASANSSASLYQVSSGIGINTDTDTSDANTIDLTSEQLTIESMVLVQSTDSGAPTCVAMDFSVDGLERFKFASVSEQLAANVTFSTSTTAHSFFEAPTIVDPDGTGVYSASYVFAVTSGSYYVSRADISITAVPEPSSFMLMGLVSMAMASVFCFKKRLQN